MLYNILKSTCLSGSLATNRASSDVFETLVVAAAMDWARCSQVVVFLLLFPLRLGRDLPPISEHTLDIERGVWSVNDFHSKTEIAIGKTSQDNFFDHFKNFHHSITFIIFVKFWSLL